MKLKQIAGICKQTKTVILMDDGDRQWVGNGQSAYMLPQNLPELSESTICTILDIPSKEAATHRIQRQDFPSAYSTEDYADGEKGLMWDLNKRIMFKSMDMLPLKTSDGKVFYIPIKALKPIDDSKNLMLALRYASDDRPYIAAIDGMFLAAIIMPVRVSDELVSWLRECCSGTVLFNSREEAEDE